MPQTKQLSWIQLRVGLLVVTSLIMFGLLVFLMTGEGFFARKYTVRTYMENAGGLRTGDPVRLAGIDVGNVESIRISGSHDPKRSVEVVMRVRRKFQDELRADSLAELDAEGLLGQRFLNITRGDPGQPVVPAGGEVKLKETTELKDVLSSSADVMEGLNKVVARVDRIMTQVESGKGSLGKIIYDDSLFKKANEGVEGMNRLVAHAASGRGSLGRFLMTDELYNNANNSIGKLDRIVDDVRTGKGTLGKFIYDPALYNKVDQVAARFERIVADVEKGQGSLGKLVKDDALYNRMNAAAGSLEKVGGRLERGEGSAGKLMHDPALYNNVNSFSQEMRTLIADFRKNPKKFLTINFKLF